MKPVVLVGCPIQNRESVVEDYLDHIYNLDYPKENIIIAFYVNNNSDDTGRLILKYFKEHPETLQFKDVLFWEGKIYKGKQDPQTRIHGNRDYTLFRMVRNKFLKLILSSNFDYLYSVDSDVLVPRNSLKQLIDNDKDVCSALLFNGRSYGANRYNVALWTERNGKWEYRSIREKKILEYNEPFSVDVTGGCYLIKREVLDAGVKYDNYHLGEDAGFCKSAKEKGYNIFCDPRIKPEHLLHGKDLDWMKK